MRRAVLVGVVPHPALQIILGASDPEDFPHGQIGQMTNVQVGFVKNHNFSRLHARKQFVRPPVGNPIELFQATR